MIKRSLKIGWILPTNSPDSLFRYFLKNIEIINWDQFELLIVFQPPWTQCKIDKWINLCPIKVKYKFITPDKPVSMMDIRNQCALLDKSCDYYVLADDNFLFSKGTKKYPYDSLTRYKEVILYLEKYKNCGYVMCEGSLGGSIQKRNIKPTKAGLVSTQRGIFFRNVMEHDKNIWPQDSIDIPGTCEETIVCYDLIEKGYFPAKQFNNPTQHKDKVKIEKNKNKGTIHCFDTLYEGAIQYIRNKYDSTNWTNDTRFFPKKLIKLYMENGGCREAIDNPDRYVLKLDNEYGHSRKGIRAKKYKASDMSIIEYKNPFKIRGQHLTCPLPLTLESYWECEADCYHCMGRKLNQIWGTEQRVADPEKVKQKLINSQKNKSPRSPLACALKLKKVLWIGRKTDPYQNIELEHKVTRSYIKILTELNWHFILCSRYLNNAMRDEDVLLKAGKLPTFLVEITPGAESDWEVFERKRTSTITRRLAVARRWQNKGMRIGVRGEPFIPGYHTESQFRDILKRLKSYGLKSYNTYNLHMTDYTMKRFHDIGLDIEKIWTYNQDDKWKFIQKRLCRIADEEGIQLGCPDFVNVPKNWKSGVRTCCGVDVPNSFTFNTHTWRQFILNGEWRSDIIEKTWEGIGTEKDKSQADVILNDESDEFFTMKDAGL